MNGFHEHPYLAYLYSRKYQKRSENESNCITERKSTGRYQHRSISRVPGHYPSQKKLPCFRKKTILFHVSIYRTNTAIFWFSFINWFKLAISNTFHKLFNGKLYWTVALSSNLAMKMTIAHLYKLSDQTILFIQTHQRLPILKIIKDMEKIKK